MHWLDLEVSLFNCVADNYGRARTFRQILLTDFAVTHEYIYRDYNQNKWIPGTANDLETICSLRQGNISDKIQAKQSLQCFTPSALFACKKKGQEKLIHLNPILQLDFDGLQDYDIEEVKAAIFNLPFVCFVGKSVSGNGVFALVRIAAPEKLNEYAQRCFEVFNYLELPVDTTKGRNHTDLRFVSYDSNMLIRDDPQPLQINIRKKLKPITTVPRPVLNNTSGLVKWAIRQIENSQVGQRFETVRRVSYACGGRGCGLDEIKDAIRFSIQYKGCEQKYLTHAMEAYEAGMLKPIRT